MLQILPGVMVVGLLTGMGLRQAALHTHQQRVQLCCVVGEEPGRLLAQLTNLGDLPGQHAQCHQTCNLGPSVQILPVLTWV